MPASESGIRAAGGSSRQAVSAIVRATRNGIPACEAMRATTSLSRSTARAPVSRQARLFSSSVARIAFAPNTAPSKAPISRAREAARVWKPGSAVQRLSSDTTSVEMTTSPGRRCGASAPAMPKLIRQFARWTASSMSVAVRSRSPAPMTTGNPAARAIFASAARPEVQSTVDNRCIRTFPYSHNTPAGLWAAFGARHRPPFA